MLQHLTISNFALVDQLELELESGMTVVSGETGAGKSIMLDALALTLGNRADAGSIGSYGTKTEISADFDILANPEAQTWLEAHDVATEDHDCLLRRVINKDGRSRAFINGIPTTLSDVKSLGELLADIHSQHEHQSLLKKDTHRRLLDEFAKAQNQANETQRLHSQLSSTEKKLHEIVSNSEEQTARAQLLSYQLEEILKLNMAAGEDIELEQEQKKLANGETILTTCQSAIALCREDDQSAAIDRVSHAAQLLDGLDQPELKGIQEMVKTAQIQLEEAMADLEHFCADFEIDPARLKDVEERLSAIYELGRKHRIAPAEIPKLAASIQQELDALQDVDGQIASLEKELNKLKDQYQSSAAKLTKLRKKAAKTIQTQVTQQLGALGMSGANFAVALTKLPDGITHSNGLEDIEFLISTNPGQEPKPLNKIASGGELSRISLAIQVTTANTSRVPCLVFDEVDVGIGGATAEVVGSLLRTLGSNAQIICVTHLAQVAAQGHQHLTVAKSSKGKQTTSIVQEIGGKERVQEIARMLGGVDQTEHSIAHAEEMFQSAQQRAH